MTPSKTRYKIQSIEGDLGTDPEADNLDIFVDFANGQRFVATFFTIQNLSDLMDTYAQTGECANGLYVWAENMVVVQRLTRDVIERTVAELLEAGELHQAFGGPYDIPVDDSHT